MATKLIVGLGNPGEEYAQTRHNLGFMMVDYIAKKIDANNFEENKKINALVSKSKVEKTVIILAKPLTYVNKTGEAVNKLKNFYKVKAEDIIVVQDDLDIPSGNTKVSFDRNSGGHKGIESIMKALKTKKFHRLRIGVSARSLDKARQESDKKRDEFVMNFVTSKLSAKEKEELKDILKEGYEKILQLCK